MCVWGGGVSRVVCVQVEVCVSRGGVCVGGVCPGGVHLLRSRGTSPDPEADTPSVDRRNDTRL